MSIQICPWPPLTSNESFGEDNQLRTIPLCRARGQSPHRLESCSGVGSGAALRYGCTYGGHGLRSESGLTALVSCTVLSESKWVTPSAGTSVRLFWVKPQTASSSSMLGAALRQLVQADLPLHVTLLTRGTTQQLVRAFHPCTTLARWWSCSSERDLCWRDDREGGHIIQESR